MSGRRVWHSGGVSGRFPDLLILRHAKSAWESATDFDRPLAPRGERDAPRMGRWILDRGLVPDRILSSPARRARQTARLVAEAVGFDRLEVEFDDRIYGAGVEELLEILGGIEGGRVLLVGHNPGLELLVDRLAGSRAVRDGGKFFPTAALAHFRSGSLVEIVRPRTLGHG